jgi:hypothetical protein
MGSLSRAVAESDFQRFTHQLIHALILRNLGRFFPSFSGVERLDDEPVSGLEELCPGWSFSTELVDVLIFDDLF